jgi:beta-lactamase class A
VRRLASVGLVLVALTAVALTPGITGLEAHAQSPVGTAPTAVVMTSIGAISPADTQAVAAIASIASRTLALTAIVALVGASGATVGVTLVELGGSNPITWSQNGGTIVTAASTYKLAALMLEAENVAAGTTDPNGFVCFTPDDYEAGWFDDYVDGACYTRNELASRAAKESDNTAGHMLVRDVGGADALNAWAASVGATSSAFFDGNTTTSDDLTALWTAEASGKLGGAAAHQWLYPLLTGTTTESGVPAGVPSGVGVVHKTGTLDTIANDAALVTSGPDGAYVLTVVTDGLGGSDGWTLIAAISAAVWQFESLRTQ